MWLNLNSPELTFFLWRCKWWFASTFVRWVQIASAICQILPTASLRAESSWASFVAVVLRPHRSPMTQLLQWSPVYGAAPGHKQWKGNWLCPANHGEVAVLPHRAENQFRPVCVQLVVIPLLAVRCWVDPDDCLALRTLLLGLITSSYLLDRLVLIVFEIYHKQKNGGSYELWDDVVGEESEKLVVSRKAGSGTGCGGLVVLRFKLGLFLLT